MNDERLLKIRKEVEEWRAVMPDEVVKWEVPYLLDLLDDKNRQLREGVMGFRAKAGGVTIEFEEGTDIGWFIKMALEKGHTVHVERIEECEK